MSTLVNYLEKVRAKPETERRRILWISTTLITALIVAVWLFNLYLTGAWSFNTSAKSETDTAANTGWWQRQNQRFDSLRTGVSEGWRVITGQDTK